MKISFEISPDELIELLQKIDKPTKNGNNSKQKVGENIVSVIKKEKQNAN